MLFVVATSFVLLYVVVVLCLFRCVRPPMFVLCCVVISLCVVFSIFVVVSFLLFSVLLNLLCVVISKCSYVCCHFHVFCLVFLPPIPNSQLPMTKSQLAMPNSGFREEMDLHPADFAFELCFG